MSKATAARKLPAALVAWWKALLTPPPEESVVEWGGRAFDMSGDSAEKGPFTVRRRPYMREPLERHADGRCRVLVLCWGTQVGKTVVLYIGRFFRNRVFGYSALIVLPSISYARRIAKSRILPLLRNSAVMREIVPPVRHSITALEQYFTTCYNIITGSNSPANLAGQPVPDTVGDEPDKYDEGDAKETSACLLIPQRTKTFSYSLNTWASSPSHPEGFIWGALLDGDYRRFMFLCPGCGKRHPLTWDQFRHPADAKKASGKWDLARIENETWHECPHGCGYQFKEADKHRLYAQTESMISAGSKRFGASILKWPEAELERLPVRWIATNEDTMPGHHSYHLPSWYSPDSKCSFGQIRCQWVLADESGDMRKVQDFFNQTRAEPFDVALAAGGMIASLPRGSYEAGDVWTDEGKRRDNGNPIRAAAIDVQQSRLVIVIRSISDTGATRLWWEGEVPSWGDAEALFAAQQVGAVFVDCSYNMTATLDECIRRGWVPMRGENVRAYSETQSDGTIVRNLFRWNECQSATRGRVAVLFWASQGGQDHLAWMISGKGPGWTASAHPSEQYEKEMKSHRKTRKNGVYRWDVTSKGVDDHRWDCETMLGVGLLAFDVLPQVQSE